MKTALVVEDGITDREHIIRCLKESGLNVISSGSVEDARGKIAAQAPDIIFLDVILPGESGFEFCRELKGNPVTKKIPVIICSTKGTEVDRTWGTMLGADDYLVKPVEQESIQKTLRRWG